MRPLLEGDGIRRFLGPALVVLFAGAAAGYLFLHDGPATNKPPRGISSPAPAKPSAAAPGAVRSSGDYAARILQDDPVAFWLLNDAGGTAARDQTGRFPGTYVGSPHPGGAFSASLPASTNFDGIDDHMTANALTGVKSWPGYTMEGWVRLTQESIEEHIIAFNLAQGGNGPGLLHDQPTKKFKFRDCEGAGCAQVLSTAVPDLGPPYLLDVSVNQNNQGTLYVNGQPQAHFASQHRPPTNGLFTVGAEYDTGPTPESFFHGEIAGIAVYAHALDAETVMAHYQAGL